jgi:PAS domain-containing protein
MESDLRYQALFDRSNDAIFLVDFDQVIQAVNQKTTQLLGYEQDELIGMTIRILSLRKNPICPGRGERKSLPEKRRRSMNAPLSERTVLE